MFLRALIIFAILLIIDFYVFQGFKLLFPSRTTGKINSWHVGYWAVTAAGFCFILLIFTTTWIHWSRLFRVYPLAIVSIIYISKLFIVVFLLLDDGIRAFRFTYEFIAQKFSSSNEVAASLPNISRIKFLTQVGTAIAGVQFISLLYGMAKGAYDFRVRKVVMNFSNLPDGFDGIKILQLSDIHSGSFSGTRQLENARSLINEQGADLIFFTGDLVNDRADEAEEFGYVFEKIKSPMGVYSILGNHDYGDYTKWNSLEEKKQNLQRLKNLQAEFGWKMLNNANTYIERNNSRIGLVGVENWSNHLRFKKYGNMKDATAGFAPEQFNILLSHDPSHWNAEVTSEYNYMDLTLSGHTHGMQYGIEIPGFRWSPVQYVYKEWADLYKNQQQNLYVNRGLGFIGYPGRVGILPEITVFELRKG
ncbi:MAG: metallophosphoesterase [Bacteroidia bacterium]|nr:metallophosphoesterase [Bacteroidia bacterium]